MAGIVEVISIDIPERDELFEFRVLCFHIMLCATSVVSFDFDM